MNTIPAAFFPGIPAWSRRALWFLRNPFETFTSNVIGFKGKPFTSIGRFRLETWNPYGGFLFAARRHAGFTFPFVSYRGRFIEGYAGWRPAGTFGLALRHANAKGF